MITYDYDFFNDVLGKEQILFLKDLLDKQEKVEKDIETANLKKEQIIEKLTENNIKIPSDKPKELREYINTSEFSFESIEKLLQNLSHLQFQYNNIKKDMFIIFKIHNLNPDENTLKICTNSLIEKITSVISYEKSIEVDNQKYTLLIDNFLTNLDRTTNTIKNNMDTNISIENLQDNLVLIVSEKDQVVKLPYTKSEVEKFLITYPNDYKTPQDVIFKEFTSSYSMYNKHPVLARFREAYYLSRTKEMKSIVDSFIFAKNIMFKSEINPTIIAAVKSENQLEDYIKCLENNTLDSFPHFSIIFEVNPI